jgi:all-trans-8'-apo-beta-carotenal 15,15'-oxygenase
MYNDHQSEVMPAIKRTCDGRWSRRQFMRAAGQAAGAALLGGSAIALIARAEKAPAQQKARAARDQDFTMQSRITAAHGAAGETGSRRGNGPADVGWLAALGTSLREEHDDDPRVEGKLPVELRGTLYRNGPGLFDRNGYRKRNLLDGDGMIRAFDFLDGRVRFRNRFIRTEKFLEEEAAGRFLYPTWTTRAPRWLGNLGFPVKSQAGVTVLHKERRLFAFDEVGDPYVLDPKTLETRGAFTIGGEEGPPRYKAHTKTDAATGDWILIGFSGRKTSMLHVLVRDAGGTLKAHHRVEAPRNTYVHDFFATEHYVVVNFHAVEFSPFGLLAGLKSLTESLTWNPALGNVVAVVDKNGAEPLRIFDAPPAWMWHSLNAYEDGQRIIADFVGYDEPGHMLGTEPTFNAIMEGRWGDQSAPGTVRRYTIDLGRNSLGEETVDSGHHEFPIVNPHLSCRRHRKGYFAAGERGAWYHDGVVAIDLESGQRDEFRFGGGHYVGEPVFVPRPGTRYAPSAEREPGWLLAEVLSGDTGTSSLAVFRADDVSAGPVARILLDHHLPMSFHGWWHAA